MAVGIGVAVLVGGICVAVGGIWVAVAVLDGVMLGVVVSVAGMGVGVEGVNGALMARQALTKNIDAINIKLARVRLFRIFCGLPKRLLDKELLLFFEFSLDNFIV